MVLIETLEAVFLTEPPTVSRGFANEASRNGLAVQDSPSPKGPSVLTVQLLPKIWGECRRKYNKPEK